jgi:hemerythrin
MDSTVDLYLPLESATTGSITGTTTGANTGATYAADEPAAPATPERRSRGNPALGGLPVDRMVSETIFGALIDSGSLALATFDLEGIRFASPGFLRLLGLFSEKGETATSWCRRLHRADRERVSGLVLDAMANSKALATECLITQPGGEVVRAHLAGYPAGPLSRGVFTLLLHVDVQSRGPVSEPRLPATVRKAFAGGKSEILDRASDLLVDAWLKTQHLAVLAVGLGPDAAGWDEARRIHAEETLLQRLRACLRNGEAIGRNGDKGLLIAILNLSGPYSAGIVAGRVIDAVAHASAGGPGAVPCECNIGIALFPDDDQELSGLLSHAGAALEYARQWGAGHFSLAETSLNRSLLSQEAGFCDAPRAGHTDIDVQHGHLLEALRAAAHDMAASPDPVVIRATLERVHQALENAFRLEDAIMAANPGIHCEAHRNDHERVLRNIAFLHRADAHQAIALSLQYLVQWLPAHVREHDTPLVVSTYRPLW